MEMRWDPAIGIAAALSQQAEKSSVSSEHRE